VKYLLPVCPDFDLLAAERVEGTWRAAKKKPFIEWKMTKAIKLQNEERH
jgi:hypothetical protein